MKRWIIIISVVLAVLLCVALILTLSKGPAGNKSGVVSVGKKAPDFSVTLCDGSEVSLYGLLEDHDAVFLNFFFNDCYWCYVEFPYLEEAYKEYSDNIAVLAVSPYDSLEDVAAYRDGMGLSFPMGSVEPGTLENTFGVEGFPTSFMIDREGIVCLEEGTTPSAYKFKTMFKAFTGEDYKSPCLKVEYPPVYASEFGCPVTLEGKEIAVSVAFDNPDEMYFKLEVAKTLSDEEALADKEGLYVVPKCSGTMHISVGPDVDISSVSVLTGMLVDLDCDETGFVMPFVVDENNREALLGCMDSNKIYIYRLLEYDDGSGPLDGARFIDTEW